MEPISTKVDTSALQGKSVLITGGASGIGLSTARAWVKSGAFVIIADIQDVEVGKKSIAEFGDKASYVWCDVTKWDSQVAAFKHAIAASPSGSLDIVAAFAGVTGITISQVDQVLAAGEPSLERDPTPPSTKAIDVNLTGVYYTSWLGLYYLRVPPRAGPADAAADKSLILMGSMASYMDFEMATEYASGKFGVRGLFRSIRSRTLSTLGIRCNLLAPWFADTPLLTGIKATMKGAGLDMAKAIGFVSVEACVEAATLCAVDKSINARAFAILPEGTFDLKDDAEGGWAGDQLRPIVQRRKDAGFGA